MMLLANPIGTSNDLEAEWVAWIGTLESWERNLVLRHELEWHDLLSSGEWAWADLELAIAERVAAW